MSKIFKFQKLLIIINKFVVSFDVITQCTITFRNSICKIEIFKTFISINIKSMYI